MKIEYKTGNIFDGSEPWFVHQANAQGVMRSGIAKELTERYPENYTHYHTEYTRYINRGFASIPLGTLIPYQADDRLIINLIGQENYGRDGRRYTSYDALASGFQTINEMATLEGIGRIAMPTLGSALGGGSWSVISSIIEKYSRDFTPVVYLLDGIVPDN